MGALRYIAAAAVVAACLVRPGWAKMSVIDSPHNLSATGGRGRISGLPGVSFAEERRICVFCHVPHNAAPGTPLWSKTLPAPDAIPYQLYESTTASAVQVTGKPTGSSRLCLSCHDGTIALGQYMGTPITSQAPIPTETSPYTNPNLTTDLRDDHPISIEYTDAVASKSNLASPGTLPGGVRLEGGVVLQCTSCHDPHDNQYGNFLVMNNSTPGRPNYAPGTPLCVTCHKQPNWDNSTHSSSVTSTLPNGCLNCHAVHSAPRPMRLLRNQNLEDNCYLSCHNGTDTTSVNVKPLFAAGMYRHPIDDTKGLNVHDEKESLPAQSYHVQCVDCHNAHQVNSTNAPLTYTNAPAVDGRITGVRKDNLGSTANYEYEVCFRCHGGDFAYKFSGVNEVMPNRMIWDPNQAQRFDVQNPSYHPVTADRRTSGQSLLTELQPNMRRIYCTDCHNNNLGTKAGGTGANGPHGSQYPHILIAQYQMPPAGATRSSYNKSQYALCYTCHLESFVMVSGSAFFDVGTNQNLHFKHVSTLLIPCFACHDPHGTSYKLGATVDNNSHLINFDKGYAAGTDVPAPLYTSSVSGAGSCTVQCHTSADHTHSYAATAGKRLFLQKKKTLLKIR